MSTETISLLFCSRGIHGLIPKLCPKFDPLWSGVGIFHDVAEHAFEYAAPFLGQYAENISGEIAAHGAMWYYVDEMEVPARGPYTGKDPNLMTQVPLSLIEATLRGVSRYGDQLLSPLPPQDPVDNPALEEAAIRLYDEAHRLRPTTISDFGVHTDWKYQYWNHYTDPFRDSLKHDTIRDLYRWGYRYAKERVPNTRHNQAELKRFLAHWDDFTLNCLATDFVRTYDGIDFTLTREGDDVKWAAQMTGRSMVNPYETMTIGGSMIDYTSYQTST